MHKLCWQQDRCLVECIMFLCLLFALSVFATERVLTPEEERVLHAIWGLQGAQSYIELENNPTAFWEETEKKLFESKDRLKTHFEFCQWFMPVVKKRLAEKLEGLEIKPWFSGALIEAILEFSIAKDSEHFTYALTTCYTLFYDYTCIYLTKEVPPEKKIFRTNLREWCSTLKQFCEMLEHAKTEGFKKIIPEYYKTLRWQVTPDGLFSFFDSLVCQSKGFQLCAVSSNPEDWDCFCVHDGEFCLCSGIQDHDAFTHAWSANRCAAALREHNISAQDQFNACCNPEVLAAGNLITMSHQVQAWFTQFHEGPSQVGGFYGFMFTSLLFPGSASLSDTGLRDITPYFAHLPIDHNWHITTLKKAEMSDEAIQGTLLSWRSLHCLPSFRLLPETLPSQLLRIIASDFHHLTEADLMRSPHFIPTILDIVCDFAGDSEAINTQERLEDFVKKHKAATLTLLQKLAKLQETFDDGPPTYTYSMVVDIPYYTYFFAVVCYAKELRALRQKYKVTLLVVKEDFHIFVFDENRTRIPLTF